MNEYMIKMHGGGKRVRVRRAMKQTTNSRNERTRKQRDETASCGSSHIFLPRADECFAGKWSNCGSWMQMHTIDATIPENSSCFSLL